MKDHIANIQKAERRYFEGETRAEKESRTIVGRGVVYNRLSENFAPWHEGGLYEIIERGAADGLLDDENIMVLLNHDTNQVLARNNNTAKLEDREDGIYYRFEAPDTTTGNDTLTNVRLGNIRKSSFAFTPKDVKMERMVEYKDMGRINIRRITKFERLFDMSVVTYPAYDDTPVMARSILNALEELSKQKVAGTTDTDKREAQKILEQMALQRSRQEQRKRRQKTI